MQIDDKYMWLIGGLGAGIIIAIIFYYLGLRRMLMKTVQKRLVARQDQFISIASHYLLSPISIIQAAVSDLQNRETSMTSQDRLKLYDIIYRGQQRLLILSEQLLIVGQIDQNLLNVQVAVADITDVVSDAIAKVDPFARQKQLKIKFFDQSQDVHQSRFDARHLKQALVAILDNAIKFSQDNSEITVQLALESNIFTIVVEDHGIGMPQNIINHLSEKFYRGTQLYSFDYEGMGLGLHIAYAIINLHGGSLTFRSKPKQGTVAIIQLPNI